MNIGQRIREARKEKKMSQEDLAIALNASAVSISYWETGQREVKPSTIERIAIVLEKPITYFYTEKTGPVKLKDSKNILNVAHIPFSEIEKEDFSFSTYSPSYWEIISETNTDGYREEDLFVTYILDNSLFPEIKKGDKIVMVATDIAYNGDLVIVKDSHTQIGYLDTLTKYRLTFGSSAKKPIQLPENSVIIARGLSITRTLERKSN